jgi:peptidoglycan hydrolase-like protein with peptidoglycan-binding domain
MPQGQAAPQGQAQIQQGQAGSVTLNAEQRTRVRETIFASANVPRVSNVNFAVRVGTVVPTSVRVVEVPEVLIGIHPEWRGHYYFVVNDDIVIVDREHRIVAEVPVGPSGAQLDNRGGGMSGGAQFNAESVSVEQIREVQIALKQQGFDIEVDGKLGPRTEQALMSFQQRNGLQATGRIDQQTFASVTKSTTGGPGNARGNQGQSTTGQGGAAPAPSGQSPTGQSPTGQAPTGQAPTGQAPTGQAPAGQGSNMQQPPANQPSANQPQANQGNQSTTGQGGGAPANNNMQPANPPTQGGAPKQGGQQR